MLLAIDIGNTNIHAGIFSGGKLVKKFYFPGNVRSYINKVDRVAIVSVAPAKLKSVLATLRRYYKGKINIVGRDIAVPLKSMYDLSQIGGDRLVQAYAASRLYGFPAMVMVLGTGVTFDIVDKKATHIGGLIFPGAGMSLSSLHARTAQLPRISDIARAKGVLGRNTRESINNGIALGYACLAGGLAALIEKKYGRMKIIVSGGDARLVSGKALKGRVIIDENLCLKGLSLLSCD